VSKNDERISWVHSTPFILVHLAPLLALWTGARWADWILCVVLYYGRMFFLTAGYHRYFAHRSYKLGRSAQFVMAFGGTTAAQKGVLWWSAHHRGHHLDSDTELDIHSPLKGLWWSHMGWFLCGMHKSADLARVKDLAAYPELRWLDRWWILPPTVLAVMCFWIGGWSALLIGFFLSTVLLWHGTFIINSLAHLVGRRRYATDDASRNSFWMALLTCGEGWHNNHHHCPTSARQGFRWWEIDMSWYALKALAWIGVVRHLMTPTPAQLARGRLADGVIDAGLRAFREARERARRYCKEKRAAVGRALKSAREAAEQAVRPPAGKPGIEP
jgi:stearoyl-CoA desaturase (delta-9 desaturase)